MVICPKPVFLRPQKKVALYLLTFTQTKTLVSLSTCQPWLALRQTSGRPTTCTWWRGQAGRVGTAAITEAPNLPSLFQPPPHHPHPLQSLPKGRLPRGQEAVWEPNEGGGLQRAWTLCRDASSMALAISEKGHPPDP